MKVFGLIDELKKYCKKNGIVFIPSVDRNYVNSILDWQEYEAYERVMFCIINSKPKFVNSRISEITWSGVIGLGQKMENHHESILDETPEQKYYRRLKSLSEHLAIAIGTVACDYELDVISVNMRMEVNQFDLSADFVVAEFQFRK